LGFNVTQVVLLHVVAKKKRTEGEQVAETFKKEGERSGTSFTFKGVVLEADKHGLGHTIKAYCREIAPLVLVVGDAQRKTALRTYFAECDSYCPVLFARIDADSKKKDMNKLQLGSVEILTVTMV